MVEEDQAQKRVRGQLKDALPDLFGRHFISLGDGWSVRLLRSRSWHQARIEFAAMENADPRPNAKYITWLRQKGWTWHSPGLVWTKSLVRNTEEPRLSLANSDYAAEQEFVNLANLIRQDKGLEPISKPPDFQRGFDH